MDVKLLQQTFSIPTDGVRTSVNSCSDLWRRLAFTQQTQHRVFTFGQNNIPQHDSLYYILPSL